MKYLPLSAPQAVALYLGHLAAAGKAITSIELPAPPSPTSTPPRACRRPITPLATPR